MLSHLVVFLAGFILGAFVLVTVARFSTFFTTTDKDDDDEEQDTWLS
jgi:hypothetical protein